METYDRVIQWLIDNERYEDVIKFNKSEKAKKLFKNEMIASMSSIPAVCNNIQERIYTLECTLALKEDMIKHKDYMIRSLEKDNETLKDIIKTTNKKESK